MVLIRKAELLPCECGKLPVIEKKRRVDWSVLVIVKCQCGTMTGSSAPDETPELIDLAERSAIAQWNEYMKG